MIKDAMIPKLLAAVIGAIFIAALYLIQVRYEARKLQARLDQVAETARQLEEQARRYQIELAALTDYTEIHGHASSELNMVFPDLVAGSMMTLPVVDRSRARR